MEAISDLDWDLYKIERSAVAQEWARIHQAETLLDQVNAGLDRMQQILNNWSTP